MKRQKRMYIPQITNINLDLSGFGDEYEKYVDMLIASKDIRKDIGVNGPINDKTVSNAFKVGAAYMLFKHTIQKEKASSQSKEEQMMFASSVKAISDYHIKFYQDYVYRLIEKLSGDNDSFDAVEVMRKIRYYDHDDVFIEAFMIGSIMGLEIIDDLKREEGIC